MHALIADITVAKIPVPMPDVMEAIPGKGPFGSRAPPQVVIHTGRNRFFRGLPDRVPPFITEPLGHVHFAPLPAVSKLNPALCPGVPTLLGPVLPDNPPFFRRFHPQD